MYILLVCYRITCGFSKNEANLLYMMNFHNLTQIIKNHNIYDSESGLVFCWYSAYLPEILLIKFICIVLYCIVLYCIVFCCIGLLYCIVLTLSLLDQPKPAPYYFTLSKASR